MAERPDGSGASTIGGMLVVVGCFAAFVANGAETFEGMIFALAVANLGIGLGIILLALGYLVKAIWFLPGREIDEPEMVKSDDKSLLASAAWEDCEWCGLRVLGPSMPCSRQTNEQLAEELQKIDTSKIDEKCSAELIERGWLET